MTGTIFRRLALSMFLLILAPAANGCFDAGITGTTPPADPPSTNVQFWSLSPKSYRFSTAEVQNGVGGYSPQSGYKWLVIDLDVHNNQHRSANLALRTFRVLGEDTNRYDEQFEDLLIAGTLPIAYQPQQSRSGDIYFEVPAGWTGTTVEGSKLYFDWIDPDTSQEQQVTIDLRGLPVSDPTAPALPPSFPA